jgi:hypothetical protein
LNEGDEEMPLTVEDDEKAFCHPGYLPSETWARVRAINASHLARLNGGCSRDEATCRAVQECYDVLIEDGLHRGGNLNDHGLETAYPAKVLALAVELKWQPSADLRDTEVDRGFLDWLRKMIEPRAEYWRAYGDAQPFGIELPRPPAVIRSLPTTTPDSPEETTLEWGDIEISFFNEHTVQITTGQTKVTQDFGALGMADKRSGKPTLAWGALHALAAKNGVIDHAPENIPDWTAVEKRMQEIRAWLRKRYGISSDPVPYVRGTGYRTRFKINRAPSYQD